MIDDLHVVDQDELAVLVAGPVPPAPAPMAARGHRGAANAKPAPGPAARPRPARRGPLRRAEVLAGRGARAAPSRLAPGPRGRQAERRSRGTPVVGRRGSSSPRCPPGPAARRRTRRPPAGRRVPCSSPTTCGTRRSGAEDADLVELPARHCRRGAGGAGARGRADRPCRRREPSCASPRSRGLFVSRGRTPLGSLRRPLARARRCCSPSSPDGFPDRLLRQHVRAAQWYEEDGPGAPGPGALDPERSSHATHYACWRPT